MFEAMCMTLIIKKSHSLVMHYYMIVWDMRNLNHEIVLSASESINSVKLAQTIIIEDLIYRLFFIPLQQMANIYNLLFLTSTSSTHNIFASNFATNFIYKLI